MANESIVSSCLQWSRQWAAYFLNWTDFLVVSSITGKIGGNGIFIVILNNRDLLYVVSTASPHPYILCIAALHVWCALPFASVCIAGMHNMLLEYGIIESCCAHVLSCEPHTHVVSQHNRGTGIPDALVWSWRFSRWWIFCINQSDCRILARDIPNLTWLADWLGRNFVVQVVFFA